MAGSYKHIVDEQGRLLNNENFVNTIDNLGDAYEMAEELYGMVWFLATRYFAVSRVVGGPAAMVEIARRHAKEFGIVRDSPGVQD